MEGASPRAIEQLQHGLRDCVIPDEASWKSLWPIPKMTFIHGFKYVIITVATSY
jgi:hypothetical protein